MSDYAGFVDDTFAVGDLQPSQWKDLWHHINEPSPEVRLLTAILEDALRCYQILPSPRKARVIDSRHTQIAELQKTGMNYGMIAATVGASLRTVMRVLNRPLNEGYRRKPKTSRQQLQAEHWIFHEDDYRFTFSFTQVCEVLGIDPGALRARLRQAPIKIDPGALRARLRQAPIKVERSRPRQGNMAVRGRRER